MIMCLKYTLNDYHKGGCDYLTADEKIDELTGLCRDLTEASDGTIQELVSIIRAGPSPKAVADYMIWRVEAILLSIPPRDLAGVAIATLLVDMVRGCESLADVHTQLANIVQGGKPCPYTLNITSTITPRVIATI
jgi:hypothetical protein